MSKLQSTSIVVLLLVAGTLNAQPFQLSSSPVHAGGSYALSVTGGPPNQDWHVGFDRSAGPTATPIGTFELGFSSQFFMVAWLQTDGTGSGTLTGSAVNATAGDLFFVQAAVSDPASPNGATISNPFSGAIHPVAPAGTPAPLVLSDDQSVRVDLGMPFPFFGAAWTECYVSSNGLITFGAGSVDPTEQISDFMAGLPKIAALWDDLSPQIQGSVHTEAGQGWFRAVWTDVPQFYLPDSNSAAVTLWSDGRIQLCWPLVELQDGLVGIGPGGWQGTPTFADFSAGIAEGWTAGPGPVFEQFLPGSLPFDLEGLHVSLLPQPAGGYRWIR